MSHSFSEGGDESIDQKDLSPNKDRLSSGKNHVLEGWQKRLLPWFILMPTALIVVFIFFGYVADDKIQQRIDREGRLHANAVVESHDARYRSKPDAMDNAGSPRTGKLLPPVQPGKFIVDVPDLQAIPGLFHWNDPRHRWRCIHCRQVAGGQRFAEDANKFLER